MTRWSSEEFEVYRKAHPGPERHVGPGPKAPRVKDRTVVRNGESFASGLEADVIRDLDLEEKAGLITGLVRQQPFPIVWNEVLICTYVADAVYLRNGKREVVDAKGFRTEIFKLKKKLMKAAYGVEIIEVTKAGKR